MACNSVKVIFGIHVEPLRMSHPITIAPHRPSIHNTGCSRRVLFMARSQVTAQNVVGWAIPRITAMNPSCRCVAPIDTQR